MSDTKVGHFTSSGEPWKDTRADLTVGDVANIMGERIRALAERNARLEAVLVATRYIVRNHVIDCVCEACEAIRLCDSQEDGKGEGG